MKGQEIECVSIYRNHDLKKRVQEFNRILINLFEKQIIGDDELDFIFGCKGDEDE
ncbi:hypothetical protein [Thomasclavelia sp.]|uniref:hypothetical protein n=1 Tax=Thomasclavelia sp. TaxID=3025757 RepID=UPI0025D69ADC|nr:hypothetical protein [Thomasclavelia sp.]